MDINLQKCKKCRKVYLWKRSLVKIHASLKLDSYTSKKAAVILTFWYKCSQYKSLAKRPRNESIEKQRSNTN
ncbi:hypothetical protein GLOIN_2v1779108 [Rhizophagus irregularis DAOM 181602=DAOM 197198]|uniref:Uncharacterized protein n=1 Tax=Rhizophagus irregularis (strain DAOM 181602 / DAOM 197198 / MUCL 43194) TaxID=747089 RepID=A0A2P4PQQ5_RHIID|nr:hypothetical protein GLOIN_2v1779108 [Rhizophagus irregularis DAOM 181602=DAOM 197198]POG67729.1 hypothetical protein GLOIN_2v1779108 [Rhizophagus irregularis DAOM 181602=DAOM 197198]GET64907.1 hypothetical protein GLOIN_2v1779108 [Rhizophagus irregularis DAOM 181602=DAOM 197198]|eukprot:XP_025174595.1 hypothetical protein GLOIN_2v1779108 [Rhizophagus irregularis DAOM 181602=DAOM 197198]